MANKSLLIEKSKSTDLGQIFSIYQLAKKELDRIGIFQWTDDYPTISIIEADINKSVLYTLKHENKIIGAVNINEEQDSEYKTIDWEFDDKKVLVIHRLVVNPEKQGNGYAKQLMDFAEDFAVNNDYSSIRLDVYSKNEKAVKIYKKRDYFIRGNVYFHERQYPFYCMEKEVRK